MSILCNVPFPVRVKRFLILFFNVHCSIVFLKATNHFAHGEKKVQLVFNPTLCFCLSGKTQASCLFWKTSVDFQEYSSEHTLTPKPSLQAGAGISRSAGDGVQLSEPQCPLACHGKAPGSGVATGTAGGGQSGPCCPLEGPLWWPG